MNEIQIFKNDDFGELRALEIDGEPWFVGKDVAIALGYEKPRNAITQHCKGALKYSPLETPGGKQNMRVISEPDVYRLIINSKLESAQKFEAWVMEEVLPSIRKHGAYMTPDMIERAILDPDVIINLATQLKQEQEKAQKLTGQVKELEPKAKRYESLTNAGGVLSTTEIAKSYGYSARAFNKLLNGLGIQWKVNNTWVLTQAYAAKHYVEYKSFEFKHSDGRTGLRNTMMWTPKGREFIHEFLRERGILPINEQTLALQN
ncbi:MAG: phage antirepressor [Coriobacteriia bacterium]|nr:phage antirepressor [Coriobacteriia bacterium]